MIGICDDKVKKIAIGDIEIPKVCLGDIEIFRSQIAPPALTVKAPTGTSSSSPTYTTKTSYTVSGTFTTEGTVTSVTVNGKEATISGNSFSYKLSRITANKATKITVIATDNYGNTTTVVRYLYRRADYTDSSFGVSVSVEGSYSSYDLIKRANGSIMGGTIRTASTQARLTLSYTFKIPTGYKAYSVARSGNHESGNIEKTSASAGTSITVHAYAYISSDGYNVVSAKASIESVTFYISI